MEKNISKPSRIALVLGATGGIGGENRRSVIAASLEKYVPPPTYVAEEPADYGPNVDIPATTESNANKRDCNNASPRGWRVILRSSIKLCDVENSYSLTLWIETTLSREISILKQVNTLSAQYKNFPNRRQGGLPEGKAGTQPSFV